MKCVIVKKKPGLSYRIMKLISTKNFGAFGTYQYVQDTLCCFWNHALLIPMEEAYHMIATGAMCYKLT
jgi:hypothetical protein